jgi:hypothetical protein
MNFGIFIHMLPPKVLHQAINIFA